MVHLSLERMLHERVGLQEKDLLRSQLEAEREGHRVAKVKAEEVKNATLKLQAEAVDYQVHASFCHPSAVAGTGAWY